MATFIWSTVIIEMKGGTSGLEIDMVHGHEQKGDFQSVPQNPQLISLP